MWPTDWWYVSKGEKLSGWVPKSYLQRLAGDVEDFLDDPEEWTSNRTAVNRRSYLAIADYETSEPNQLTFEEGAKVTVLDKEDDGERCRLNCLSNLIICLLLIESHNHDIVYSE